MTPRRLVPATLALLVLVVAAPVFADGDPWEIDPAVAAPQDGSEPPVLEGPNFTPAPKPMAPICHFCGSWLQTPILSGSGGSCSAAQSDVKSQVLAYVNASCLDYGDAGRCSYQFVYYNTCYFDSSSGQYVSDAFANYRCWTAYC
ncbi:MAG TPA: hypothetical protein VF017_23455 [Thermoanaerobaculia bacterium]|nr:hypothetical protein [Thermoanaerobaculia bacterium]